LAEEHLRDKRYLALELLQSTTTSTVNKVCGSGMKTVMLAHDSIMASSANIMLSRVAWKVCPTHRTCLRKEEHVRASDYGHVGKRNAAVTLAFDG
jgi:hypothetical protein